MRKRGGAPNWRRCPACAEILPAEDVQQNFEVCPRCDHHYPLGLSERLALLIDEGTFQPLDRRIDNADLLRFKADRRYRDQLSEARKRTGADEAVLAGAGLVEGSPVMAALVNADFLDGSLGCVAAERVGDVFEQAAAQRQPALLVVAGGGVRVQEGLIGLLQPARLADHRAMLYQAGVLLLSILVDPLPTHPVWAVAFSADVVLAEPTAQSPTRPAAAQLAEQGLVDRIVPRQDLKADLSRLIRLLS